MKVSREYLRNKYDYNPELNVFTYKENPSKGDEWNKKYSGKEVKVIYSSGKRYLFCLDALYNIEQLITIYEIGDYTKPTSYSQKDLIEESLEVNNALSKLSIKKLNEVQKRLIEGDSIINVVNHVKGKRIRCNILDVNDTEINPLTGFPKHIYFDNQHNFYVKIKYKSKMHARTHFKNVEEALQIRNVLYEELNTANSNGEDMANYVSSSGRK